MPIEGDVWVQKVRAAGSMFGCGADFTLFCMYHPCTLREIAAAGYHPEITLFSDDAGCLSDRASTLIIKPVISSMASVISAGGGIAF